MSTNLRWVAAFTLAMAIWASSSTAQIPVTDLGLWLKADAGVSKTQAIFTPAGDGDPVPRWDDQSGNGNNATLPGSSTQATYILGAINGYPVVNFDSVSDRLQLPTPLVAGTTDYSIFAVARSSNWGAEHYIGGNYGFGNFSGLEFFGYSADLAVYHGTTIISSGDYLAPNTPYVLQADKSGSTITLWINGAQVASGTAVGSIGSGLNWTIGNGPDYGVSAFGDMAEQIVYTRSLGINGSDQHQVLEYLLAKYSIPEPSTGALGLIVLGLGLRMRRSVR